jgi:hypothetical protein
MAKFPMAFFPKLQLFVGSLARDASFAQACRKHKLPCLRRKNRFHPAFRTGMYCWRALVLLLKIPSLSIEFMTPEEA